MAVVTLRSPLRELAEGRSSIDVQGGTVEEIVSGLERAYPRLEGWMRDETGHIREHITVFVGGERATLQTSVQPSDKVHVLASISGGSMQTLEREQKLQQATDEQAELLVGTRKGLFVLRGARGMPMEIAARTFEGSVVEFAMRDDRTGRYFASVTDFFGPHVFHAEDVAAEWEEAKGPAFPEGGETALERTWAIRKGVEPNVMWAGAAPASLWKSEDGGLSWSLNEPLWNDPSRPSWNPGAGGLALHSISIWPEDPNRIAVGISAAGVWLSDDGGASWRRGIKGIVPHYLPEEAREGAVDLCVHNMHRTPVEPETIYMQFHGGVYRSDDAGESWNDIGTDTGLPSDFGFPMVVDPHRADHAYVIPLVADRDRVTPDARVAVWETTDRGASWHPLTEGLPQQDAYLTILRQAFCHDGRQPLGLYFGAESGEVFGSVDGGQTWFTAAEHLAPVTSVRCSS